MGLLSISSPGVALPSKGASRSAPVGSAVASEAPPHGLAKALKRIEPESATTTTINDGKHAERALADLAAKKARAKMG
jgi:hypothetical protein